jgi:hypothetical protein
VPSTIHGGYDGRLRHRSGFFPMSLKAKASWTRSRRRSGDRRGNGSGSLERISLHGGLIASWPEGPMALSPSWEGGAERRMRAQAEASLYS